MGSRWRDFTTSLALTVLQGPEKVLALGRSTLENVRLCKVR